MSELEKEIKGRTFGYVSAALGLVAGLAWNDAISFFIETLFPLSQDTILLKFIYAVAVSVVVVVLIKYLDTIVNKKSAEENNKA